MKIFRISFLFGLLFLLAAGLYALEEQMAAPQDLENLKKDLVSGRILVGKSRLADIRRYYGDAQGINDSEKTIVYDYGDLKIEFDKARYLRDWEYDSSRRPAYTIDVNNLRKDLESEKIEGDLITYEKIKKDYGVPTENLSSQKDGEKSVYYYGDIKLIFENKFLVKSWKGKNLEVMAPVAVAPVKDKPKPPKETSASGSADKASAAKGTQPKTGY